MIPHPSNQIAVGRAILSAFATGLLFGALAGVFAAAQVLR